jgi:RimJ/RimL family protein N-acetyltransferase
MPVVLHQLSLGEIESLLAGGQQYAWQGLVHSGALPPRSVLQRALDKVASGESMFWWCPFLILEQDDQAVAGGCAFKGLPKGGRAEILYGVARSRRGQGIASAAVHEMATIAFANGAKEVLAEIEPQNLGSIGVVRKCGFVCVGERIADDGALVEQWLLVQA